MIRYKYCVNKEVNEERTNAACFQGLLNTETFKNKKGVVEFWVPDYQKFQWYYDALPSPKWVQNEDKFTLDLSLYSSIYEALFELYHLRNPMNHDGIPQIIEYVKILKDKHPNLDIVELTSTAYSRFIVSTGHNIYYELGVNFAKAPVYDYSCFLECLKFYEGLPYTANQTYDFFKRACKPKYVFDASEPYIKANKYGKFLSTQEKIKLLNEYYT